MFILIRVFSGHPVVDAVKLALYRPSFYRVGGLTQEAMRGPSDWSVADRELMAAYVSKINETEFCVAAHTATASLAFNDGAKVSAALADLDSAPLTEALQHRCCRHTKGVGFGCVGAPDQGRASGRIRIQCDRPIGRRLRFRGRRPGGYQRWRKVPARAGLPVTADWVWMRSQTPTTTAFCGSVTAIGG